MAEESDSAVPLELGEPKDVGENVHEAPAIAAEKGTVEVTLLQDEDGEEDEEVEDLGPATHDGMPMSQLIKMEVIPCYSMSSVISATYFTSMLVSTLEVVYVGHLGKKELAAVALAVMFSNVTGYSIAIGGAQALAMLSEGDERERDIDSERGKAVELERGNDVERGMALRREEWDGARGTWWRSREREREEESGERDWGRDIGKVAREGDGEREERMAISESVCPIRCGNAVADEW